MMQGRCRSVRTSQVPAVCGTGYTELDFERSKSRSAAVDFAPDDVPLLNEEDKELRAG